jgi:subtilisin family serine protease
MSVYVRKAVSLVSPPALPRREGADSVTSLSSKDLSFSPLSTPAPSLRGRAGGEAITITTLVKTSDIQLLKQNGCKIYANWDDIYIASIPLDKISALCSYPSIHRIEAGKSCFVTNDNSATIVRAKDVWNNPEPLSATGKGVVVGVMDIGFDFTHPNWYSADMQEYRIKQVWDMLDYSENGEAVIGKTEDGQDTIYVGRQYIGAEAILNKRYSADGLTQYHGTHTMGTATGSGAEGNGIVSQYVGMAPDAEICVVANYTTNNEDVIPETDIYKYTTATDLLGFKYIFDYAESVGKPCVINFSEGTYDELNESKLYQEVLNKMVGPGRILCSAAGNDGTKNTYIHKAKGENKKGTFLTSATQDAGYVMRSKKPVKMQLSFYQKENKVRTWEYDMTKLSAFPDSVMTDTLLIGKERFAISLCTYPECYDNTLYASELQISDVDNDSFGKNTEISFAVLGSDNDIEVFFGSGSFKSSDLDKSLCDFQQTHSMYFPASTENVIAIGASAHVTKVISHTGYIYGDNLGTNGVRANFSSIGPALNGCIKPDVMAPGVNIVSSTNSYREDLHLEEKYGSRVFEYEGRKHYWAMAKGTSMACPAVTGVIALWLQVCPTLTPEQIKDVFAHTCTHYDESLSYPNNYYGWGEIDALAGIKYINRIYTGIEEHIINDNIKTIYDINGLKVDNIKHPGIYIISNGKNRKKVLITK